MKTSKSIPAAKEKTLKVPLVMGGSIILVAIAATSFAILSTDDKKESNSKIDSEDSENQILKALNYKDGTYTTDTSYFVEVANKTDHIRVTITVENSKITAVHVDPLEDGVVVESKYMDEFNSAIAEKVVGKKFSDIYGAELVSGSTLTSSSFKDALRVIEDKAEE